MLLEQMTWVKSLERSGPWVLNQCRRRRNFYFSSSFSCSSFSSFSLATLLLHLVDSLALRPIRRWEFPGWPEMILDLEHLDSLMRPNLLVSELAANFADLSSFQYVHCLARSI